MSVPLLVNATVIGIGNSVRVPLSDNMVFQTTYTGAPTALVIDIEGSLDGLSYFPLKSVDIIASGGLFHIPGQPVVFIRANLKTLTGIIGVTPTVYLIMEY